MKKILIILVSIVILTLSQIFIGDALAVNNPRLDNLNTSEFINTTNVGEQGIVNTLLLFARDLKNLFYIIATIFFLVIILRLIFSSNTEEELGKFKKGLIWITIGVIVMQIAFVFTTLLFDRGVSTSVAVMFFDNLVWPLVTLLQTLASFFFIAIAIYAFYRLVTANGNEEAVSSAKKTIGFALIGFLVVRFAREVVEAFYGRINCEPYTLGTIVFEGACRNIQNLSSGVQIIISIINWLNAFVAIVVVLMILYAGAQILLSAGDEEKLKKSKNSLVYIAIGIFILIANFLILTFFLRPESII